MWGSYCCLTSFSPVLDTCISWEDIVDKFVRWWADGDLLWPPYARFSHIYQNYRLCLRRSTIQLSSGWALVSISDDISLSSQNVTLCFSVPPLPLAFCAIDPLIFHLTIALRWQLQVTALVSRSNYAFHLIAEGETVFPFSGGFFVRLTVLPQKRVEVTYHIP